MFSTLDVSTSGLVAQRIRLDTIAQNIANAQVTRARIDENGNAVPYRRRQPIFAQMLDESGNLGVAVTDVVEDNSGFRQVYDPDHPDANKDGYVLYPNVNLVNEMVDSISATRAYEANVTAMNATKSMIASSLKIIL